MTIGMAMKEIRERMGLSLEDMAIRTYWSIEEISLLESSTDVLSESDDVEFSRATGISAHIYALAKYPYIRDIPKALQKSCAALQCQWDQDVAAWDRGVMCLNIRKTIDLIAAARLDLSNEKSAQHDLNTVFRDNNRPFIREFRLTDRDIIDFFSPGMRIGVEVKLKGAPKQAVFKQLERYADSDILDSIILASNLSMGLPPAIEYTDLYFVQLGAGWL